jgi:F-box-like
MTYRALDIPEVLSLIFEEADQAVLARAAQCCKAFSNLALDVLWRDLPSPEPLRKLLPLQFDNYAGV